MRLALTLLVIVLSGCATPLLTPEDHEAIAVYCEAEESCIKERTEVKKEYVRENRRILKRAKLMAHIRACEASGYTIVTVHRGIHQDWKERDGTWNPPRNASITDAPCMDAYSISQMIKNTGY